jgi:hypothetical protein
MSKNIGKLYFFEIGVLITAICAITVFGQSSASEEHLEPIGFVNPA